MGLNKKRIAIFNLPRRDDGLRVVVGDELILHVSKMNGEWSGSGFVMSTHNDEIYLEMKKYNKTAFSFSIFISTLNSSLSKQFSQRSN